MSLNSTAKLKEVWSSQPHYQVMDALIISHPKFTRTYYIINDTSDHLFYPPGAMDKAKFLPVPFKIQLPEVGSAQQDLDIILPNIDFTLQEELDYAQESSNEPINIEYIVYVEGSDQPQANVPDLEFVSVTLDSTQLVGKAVRKDLYNRYVMNDLYDFRFEGLWL